MHASKSAKKSSGRKSIVIDPITRIEGHMKFEATVDGGEVKDARCAGTLFRGFECILVGRDPLDAARLTQRVCGVCPTSHGTASAMCLDDAFGLSAAIPPNGRLVRNLLLGCNVLQSHILHFFALAALDFVDVTALADYAGKESELKAVRSFIERRELSPFFPRYEGDYRCTKQANVDLVRAYLKALGVRRVTHEMLSVFGGKVPHNIAIVPGGVTCEVTPDKIATFAGKLEEVSDFIDDVYLPAIFAVAEAYPDYLDIGRGCGRFLAYGTFNTDDKAAGPLSRNRLLPSGLLDADGALKPVDAGRIAEDVTHSRYTDRCTGHPADGDTDPDADKDGAYSWIKAPRYDGAPAEVGPLARAMVAWAGGDKLVKPVLEAAAKAAAVDPRKLPSVLGRHLARALECRIVADAMARWLDELRPGQPAAAPFEIPETADGVGLTDAPRAPSAIGFRSGTTASHATNWSSPPPGTGRRATRPAPPAPSSRRFSAPASPTATTRSRSSVSFARLTRAWPAPCTSWTPAATGEESIELPDRAINIVGVGNTLMGDDGVGPAVVAALRRRDLPAAVRLFDAGLAAADVLSTLDPDDPLIVIDSLRAGGKPGATYRARLSDVDWASAGGAGTSLHELSVLPALRMETLAGREFQDVTVYGIEPAVLNWGEGLSPTVRRAVDRLADTLAERFDAPDKAPCPLSEGNATGECRE